MAQQMADNLKLPPTRRKVVIIWKKKMNQVEPIVNDTFQLQHKKEEKEEEEYPDYTISFPGSQKVFGSGINPWRRTIWCLIVLVFAAMTVYQVQERVCYYLKTPINIHVTITTNETLEFPLTTICTREPFNYTAMEELRPQAANALGVDSSTIRLPYDLLALMDLTTLWNRIGHNLSVMTRECWFGRMKNCDSVGKWNQIFTMMGPSCYQYRLHLPVAETGLFNGMYIQMLGEKLTQPKIINKANVSSSNSKTVDVDIDNNGWEYVFHSANVNPSLLIYDGDYMNPSSSVDVQVSLEEQNGLDVWHSPCVDNVTYTTANCELMCLSNQVVKRVGCRLPFMLQTEPPSNLCRTPDSYKDADELLDSMIKDSQWKVSDCNCTRQCFNKIYVITKEKVLADVKPNRLRFRAFYQDTTFEVAEERHAYDLITLFCDIGSSMGLLLGISVLTWVEAFEWVASLCHRLLTSTGTKRRH